MAEGNKKYIKKIKLSDNQIYYVCDSEAARQTALEDYLPKTGGTITGSLEINEICKANNLYILQTTELSYEEKPTNVLVKGKDGEIKTRNINYLLEDAGGVSYSMDDENCILTLRIGKEVKTN